MTSAIRILDGKNGYISYSQFVCEVEFNGVCITDQAVLTKEYAHKYDQDNHILSIKLGSSTYKLPNVYTIDSKPKQALL